MAAPVFVGRAHELAALRAGASGFLLKDTPPADLLAAIRLIAEFARRPGTRPAARRDPWQASPTGSARS